MPNKRNVTIRLDETVIEAIEQIATHRRRTSGQNTTWTDTARELLTAAAQDTLTRMP